MYTVKYNLSETDYINAVYMRSFAFRYDLIVDMGIPYRLDNSEAELVPFMYSNIIYSLSSGVGFL